MTTYAGQWGPEDFQSRAGTAVPAASVTVYEIDGVTLATLWADRDRGTPLANPLPTGVPGGHGGLDAQANGLFWADPGRYVLVGKVGGIERLRTVITVDTDPSESGGGGVISVNGRAGLVVGLAEESDVTAEATTRAAADTALGTSIGNEATARASADATLASEIAGLATVASTGAYADLTGKPALGTAAAATVGTATGDLPTVGEADVRYEKLLLATATKTASYGASPGEIIPLDTTSGTPIVVTLPTAPPDGTQVEVGWIAGANATATIVPGGSGTFQGGGTTSSLLYLFQFRRYIYRASGDLWLVQNSMPLSGLDARYAPIGTPETVINIQNGTSYMLGLTDAGGLVIGSNVGAFALSIPTDATVALPVKTRIDIAQGNTGQVTIAAVTPGTTFVFSAGATPAAPKLRVQYSGGSLIKVGANQWLVVGDIV